MNKQELTKTIEETHQQLIDYLINQSDELWEQNKESKWSTGQHVKHINGSLKALQKGLKFPWFVLRYKFGKANRPTRSFIEVTERYESKLSKNLEHAKAFNKRVQNIPLSEKQATIEQLTALKNSLILLTNKKSDKKLDTLLLPHPLMGKMIMREIIMWICYHTDQHFKMIQRDYS